MSSSDAHRREEEVGTIMTPEATPLLLQAKTFIEQWGQEILSLQTFFVCIIGSHCCSLLPPTSMWLLRQSTEGGGSSITDASRRGNSRLITSPNDQVVNRLISMLLQMQQESRRVLIISQRSNVRMIRNIFSTHATVIHDILNHLAIEGDEAEEDEGEEDGEYRPSNDSESSSEASTAEHENDDDDDIGNDDNDGNDDENNGRETTTTTSQQPSTIQRDSSPFHTASGGIDGGPAPSDDGSRLAISSLRPANARRTGRVRQRPATELENLVVVYRSFWENFAPHSSPPNREKCSICQEELSSMVTHLCNHATVGVCRQCLSRLWSDGPTTTIPTSIQFRCPCCRAEGFPVPLALTALLRPPRSPSSLSVPAEEATESAVELEPDTTMTTIFQTTRTS